MEILRICSLPAAPRVRIKQSMCPARRSTNAMLALPHFHASPSRVSPAAAGGRGPQAAAALAVPAPVQHPGH